MYLSLLVGFSALMFCCNLANASARVDETPPHNLFDHSPPQPLQRKIHQSSAAKATIAEEFDSVLDADVLSALSDLQAQYPLNPEEDLGEDLKTYLKGTEGWDNYLTSDVEKYIEAAKKGDVEALWYLGSSFKGGGLPCNNDDLAVKLLVAASLKASANALSSLSGVFKRGLGAIKPNEQLKTLFYNAAVTMPGKEGDEVRAWLELPPPS